MSAQKRQTVTFGKYLLLDRVNIGGMAEVWRAKTFGAGGFERLVAIKRILPNIAEDEDFIKMFIDEAKITVQLNHANVARIDELRHIGNSYFIAMEYVSGKDLRAVFDKNRKRSEPAPIPLICYVISKCCEGLDYAHRCKDRMGRDMNIVHRDVSPQNLLISYDGEVKVIDFGIAKAAGKATKTQAGILKGKFGYMSPEQIRGLPLDRRSDVFAIGVCLYELLTGERLFVGETDFAVLEKVRKAEVTPPSHFNRRVNDALEKIVMKALAKDVDVRYQSASDLADDLTKFLVINDTVFGRKDLSAYMRSMFAEDYDKEKQRLLEYTDIQAPPGILAAIQMGDQMTGAIEASAQPGPSETFNTSPASAPSANAPPTIPTASPSSISSSSLPATSQLPPLARSVPGPGVARPSIAGLPRVTMAPADSRKEAPEHASTQVVPGDAPYDSSIPPLTQEPGSSVDELAALRPPKPLNGETATDRGTPAYSPGAEERTDGVLTPMVPVPIVLQNTKRPSSAPQLVPVSTRPSSPNVQPVPSRPSQVQNSPGSRPSSPNIGPNASRGSSPNLGQNAPRPSAVRAKQSAISGVAQQPVPSTAVGDAPKSRMFIVAVAAASVALVLAAVLIGTVLFRQPQGLLMLDLPTDVSEKTRVTVNGLPVMDPDGKPVHEWPFLLRVPAGKNTVMISAPGYERFVETIEVPEGNEYTKVGDTLKKKSPSE